ncbi:MAG: redoxin domain-containing protein [Planctomycetota bacterium]|nr:redoxin domain-containing protein [Planctomycetota bacterium]
MKYRTTALLAIVLALIVGFNVSVVAENAAKKAVVGEKYVDFTDRAITIENGEVVEHEAMNFGELIKGKTAILKFGAVWCGWCKKLAPELVKANEDEDVVVIEVDLLSERESEQTVKDYNKKQNTPWPIFLDKGKIKAKYLESGGIPQSFIFDSDGILRYHMSGYKKYEDMKPILEAIKNGEPLPGKEGSTFPDFKMEKMDGKELDSAKLRKMHKSLVIVFGVPQEKAISDEFIGVLNKVAKSHRRKAEVIYAALVHPRGAKKEQHEEFFKDKDVKFTIAYDEEYSLWGKVSNGAKSVPVVFIVNKYGIIEKRFDTGPTYDDIEKGLKKAFSAKKPKKK